MEQRRQRLLASSRDAIAAGDLDTAWRHADAARRLSPGNETALLLNVAVLQRLGDHQRALALLADARSPAAQLARARSLSATGDLRQAAAIAEALLGAVAVDALPGFVDWLDALVAARGAAVAGWVGVDRGFGLVGRVRHGGAVVVTAPGASRALARPEGNADGALPRLVLQSSWRGAIVSTSAGPVLGAALTWPDRFGIDGWVLEEDDRLVGELRCSWCPGGTVALALEHSAGRSVVEVPLTADDAGVTPFSLLVPADAADDQLAVSVQRPDGRWQALTGSPVELLDDKPLLRVAPVLRRSRAPARKGSRVVDVVVPVYADPERSLRCLDSVLSSPDAARVELVVVDDATPVPALREALRRLADDGAITLLVNEHNRGFPASANRGMALHPERDVVLLNADTEVHGDWLTRLLHVAQSNPAIGTVTPLGGAASIASYPADGGAIHGASLARLDGWAARVNAGAVVDVPVGVGFCMLIRRACLNDVGLFDERRFARGYGEENDFCLRAAERGWRHVVAGGVYVAHAGGTSFGDLAWALRTRHQRLLNQLHPGYDETVQRFAALDPLRGARRAIDLARLRARPALPEVLLVTHALPGGVKRHVGERTAQWAAQGRRVWQLRPRSHDSAELVLEIDGFEAQDLRFDFPADAPLLARLLAEAGFEAVEVHHTLGVPTALLETLRLLGAPMTVYLHDHAWICPRVTLLAGNGRYCGEPEVAACEACVVSHGSSMPELPSVAALRQRSAALLRAATAVIAPTRDVARRYERHFPGLPVQVQPWEAPVALPKPLQPRARAGGRARVAVIGAISVQKGLRVVEACAREAAEADLPLDFVVIGYSGDDEALAATGRVFVTGAYDEAEVPGLLVRESCDAVLFATVAPETWCYALTPALKSGLPIVALAIGAVEERLADVPAATLLPTSATPADINRALLTATMPTKKSAAAPVAAPTAKATKAAKTATKTTTKAVAPADQPARPAKAASRPTPAAPSTASAPRTATVPAQAVQTAGAPPSSQLVNLPGGIYSFSVPGRREDAAELGSTLHFPAMHIGLAPVKQAGAVDFIAGTGSVDRWLIRPGDRVTARVQDPGAPLLLTSHRRPEDPGLAVDIARIDVPLAPAPGAALSVRVMTHVRGIGDLHFPNGVAGPMGSGLWIEAFVAKAYDADGNSLLEYRGITADGFETPWLTEPTLCGSRGRSVPLVAFAVRVRGPALKKFRCRYAGSFLSGDRSSFLDDGQFCRSEREGDPLEGIELEITARG